MRKAYYLRVPEGSEDRSQRARFYQPIPTMWVTTPHLPVGRFFIRNGLCQWAVRVV